MSDTTVTRHRERSGAELLSAHFADLIDQQLSFEVEPEVELRGQTFELQETEKPYDPFVFVRKSDGARFEVDYTIEVRELPAEGGAPDA
jgi:hypothetical protein